MDSSVRVGLEIVKQQQFLGEHLQWVDILFFFICESLVRGSQIRER